MNFRIGVMDLSFSRVAIALGLLGFTVVLLFRSEGIVQWEDLPKWTGTGYIGRIDGGADSSCLSRSHQHLYRSNKVVPSPSVRFREAWESYLRMHRTCSEEPGRNWTQILEDNLTTSACKYLVYVETGEGLGNRLLSLVSALLYALITDRILMLDSRKELGKVLCEPFNGSSWLLPLDFPYGAIKDAPDLGQATEKHFEQVPVVHLKLAHVQQASDKRFFCDEFQESLNKVRVLAWSSNQYYVTSFFMVPVLWKKLVPLFPSRLDILAQIFSVAIFPANSVWSLISRYYDNYLSCSRKLVGVQIRPHGRPNLAAYDPSVFQVVLGCLTIPGLLSNLSTSLQYAQSLGHKVDASVLVASLQGKYYESLRDVFLRNGSGSLVNFHSLSHEGAEWHNLHQASLALAEMWLLSFSDQILTSEYSTFGYIPTGAASLRPWMMKTKGTSLNQSAAETTCYLSRSTEPCTHFPHKPDCGTNFTSEHLIWINSYIGGCQDQAGGLQLLN